MNKRVFTLLFLLVATVANIVMTAFVIIALCVVCLLLLKAFHVQNGNIATTIVGACFIGGLVLDMIAYTKIVNWVIDKFHLETKMDRSVLGKKYAKNDTEKKEKRKTNLPKSALPIDTKDEWAEAVYGEGTPSYTPLNPEDFAGAKAPAPESPAEEDSTEDTDGASVGDTDGTSAD